MELSQLIHNVYNDNQLLIKDIVNIISSYAVVLANPIYEGEYEFDIYKHRASECSWLDHKTKTLYCCSDNTLYMYGNHMKIKQFDGHFKSIDIHKNNIYLGCIKYKTVCVIDKEKWKIISTIKLNYTFDACLYITNNILLTYNKYPISIIRLHTGNHTLSHCMNINIVSVGTNEYNIFIISREKEKDIYESKYYLIIYNHNLDYIHHVAIKRSEYHQKDPNLELRVYNTRIYISNTYLTMIYNLNELLEIK
jgi:hypothetical protein